MDDSVIESIILKTVDIPTLPPIAMKVMNLIQDDFASLSILEETISRDQGFVTRLLRIANSPYYGQNRKIDDIKQALLLIGFETLKSLIVATALRDIHRKFGVFEQRLWEHSLGVALCASLIAMVTQLHKPDEALVCGLIHDVGKTAMNNSMPDLYPEVYERIFDQKRSSIHVEEEMFGFNHTTVGSLLAKKWKLPEKLEMVITYHHTFPFPEYEDAAYSDICNIVRVADQICNNLGIGLKEPFEVPIEHETLGVSDEELTEIVGLFKLQFEKQRDSLLS